MEIRGYIEYEVTTIDKKTYAHNLAKLKINKNYSLFTLLSGIRGGSIQGELPVSLPKGLPKYISWELANDAFLVVIDNESWKPGCCTRDDAEKHNRIYTDETKRYIYNPDHHTYSWLNLQEVNEVIKKLSRLKEYKKLILKETDAIPEGFTISEKHLNMGMRVAIDNKTPAPIPMEILVIKAIMEVTEKEQGNCKFVFFFDN